MQTINLRLLGAIVSLSILALAAPAAAGASVTSEYPPASEARDFAAGQGGWTASTSFTSCPLAITCPTVENTFQATGGAGGDGHIRSAFEATLTIVGTATAVWQSPSFEYDGADGEAPTSLSLALSRRADVEDLLDVTGSSATYSVGLVDLSEGDAVHPVAGPLTLEGAEAWTAVPASSVDPSSLTLGHDYAIRISSVYTPGTVNLLVEGAADYDNVVLTATRPDPLLPDDPDGIDGDGDGGGNTSTVASFTSEELLSSVQRSTQEIAQLRGKRVFVRVTCPRRVERACRITAQGMIGKRVRVTRRSTVKVASGRTKLVALRVKPKFEDEVAARKRLLIVQRVRAGDVTATFARTRVLVRRP